jgi:hypothetical protein
LKSGLVPISTTIGKLIEIMFDISLLGNESVSVYDVGVKIGLDLRDGDSFDGDYDINRNNNIVLAKTTSPDFKEKILNEDEENIFERIPANLLSSSPDGNKTPPFILSSESVDKTPSSQYNLNAYGFSFHFVIYLFFLFLNKKNTIKQKICFKNLFRKKRVFKLLVHNLHIYQKHVFIYFY